ncbi:MAG: hypothetical protein JWN48_5484 [Myxococcaceae bacterium]|nr:hypothetical protein [Myxococcaceae bacterium]
MDPRAGENRTITDESLRAERARTDQEIADHLAPFDDAAEALIASARNRADARLAELRAGRAEVLPPHLPDRETLRRQEREDAEILSERASEDEARSAARAERAVRMHEERALTYEVLLAERRHADHALAIRDEFLAIAAHELRNMLSVVAGYAEILSGDDQPERTRRPAQHLRGAAKRMNRILGDLIDVARTEAGVLTVCPEVSDLAPIVTEAVESLRLQAEASAIALTLKLEARRPAFFDSSRLLQVLVNLLNNALKCTPPGKGVSVRVHEVESEMHIDIQDSGPGIPGEMLHTIFERYRQVASGDRRGVGLGLYVCKCIVEGHRGRIWAQSELGKGTTMHVAIPLPSRGDC